MSAIEQPLPDQVPFPVDGGFPAPDGFVDPLGDPAAGAFGALAALFPVLFVAALVLGAYVAYRRWKVLHDAGLDPVAVDAQIAARLAHGPLGAPVPATATLEERLAELDDLHRRGVISGEEHRAARAAALGA